MKTQEEIEQLALSIYPIYMINGDEYWIPRYDAREEKRTCYVDGYTKCQEDMQKDVEYWQGEFEHWHQQAMDMADKYNELLNKQDNEK